MVKKKRLSLILCAAIAIVSICLAMPTTLQVHAAAVSITAKPANADVYIDGEKINIQGYNIKGNNYFKLRDLAYALNGTSKQFSVGWNAKSNTIELQLEKPYNNSTANEHVVRTKNSLAIPSRAEVVIDRKTEALTAYTIEGNNYFMLRELGKHLQFPVLWRPSDQSIHIYTTTHVDVNQVGGLRVSRGTDDYLYGNYKSVSRRYLFESGSRMFILEDPGEESDALNVYAITGSQASDRKTTVKKELPLFGGFHAGDDGNYYIVFGQDNMEESNTKPVYRVVKYDRDWNKLAHADLANVHVASPFHAGNVSMDSDNGQLVVHSTRLRYVSPNDGLRHQSNITFMLDMNTMEVIRSGEQWPDNHVSHSFATYVRKDGDRTIYADHGDAFPRAHIVQVEQDGKGIVDSVDFAPPLGGMTGDNYTGIYLGGLEVGEIHYMALSTYSKEYNAPVNSQNVRLDYFSKETEYDPYTATVWLTDHAAKDNIRIRQSHLVKINESIFVALWTEEKVNHDDSKSSLYYAIVSDTGNILQKPTQLKGIPSPGNMSPLVKGNSIIWYYAKAADYRGVGDSVEVYTLTIPSYSEQELLGGETLAPEGARSLHRVKQKLEQLGYHAESYHMTYDNYLAISDSNGLSYFNYIYYSDRDSWYDEDSGKLVRGELDHFFSDSSVSMEEQLALSKTIIETDLDVSLPDFVEQLTALLQEKSSLITDDSVTLIYSFEMNGITFNMFHYGDPAYYEHVNMRYAN